MTVEITINWNFLGEEENAQVGYATYKGHIPQVEETDRETAAEFPFVGSVVPLRSSVLAPGLSMPVPTR